MSEKILAVVDGKVNSLKSIKDGVFSEKMLGDGAVIEVDKKASEFTVVSPVAGKLVTAFPTGHAYGIETKSGLEILVHIGVDTVNLDGEGFKMLVKQGKKVKAGTPLATVNAKLIKSKVPSLNPIILITSGQPVSNVTKGEVEAGQELFEA